MTVRQLAVGAAGLIAVGVLPGVGAPEAGAAPGACSGGQLTMNTSPIGLSVTPVTAQIGGQLTGCNGTPGRTARFVGNFTGSGSCFDVAGLVNSRLQWDNGAMSTVNGPFHVAGGPTPPHSTNTLPISEGGAITVEQTGPDPAAVTGPCMAGQARNISVSIVRANFA